MVVSVKNLSKTFGRDKVFENISLSVDESDCYCLIGKNGAGKSTFINILAGILPQNSGSVAIFKKQYPKDASFIKTRMGVLPEFNPVIDEFDGMEYLEYVGYLYGLDKQIIDNRINYLVNYFFDDIDSINKGIGQFSKGMKLKIGLCSALIHKPKLLILDEPFDGLDVISSNKLVSFLNFYRSEGNTIILSSHNMLYTEKVATHIGLLIDNKLAYSLSLNQILNEGEKTLEEKISSKLGYKFKQFNEFK